MLNTQCLCSAHGWMASKYIKNKVSLKNGTDQCSPILRVYGLLQAFLFFPNPVNTTVELMFQRIGPIIPLLLLVNRFGPIRGTIKSTVVATGINLWKIKGTNFRTMTEQFIIICQQSIIWAIYELVEVVIRLQDIKIYNFYRMLNITGCS